MTDSPDNNQNRLANESSPYLLQHADNPVDWYPWGEEAFEKAKQEDKPVLVSIGYATCHWCHVMAHESFEDEEVAELMNRAFVNIKVDREERPDIDNTYMLVCQMLTGSGGWPLNVFLTPDKNPFYAATYIPKAGRQGRPGMRELIPWISKLWQNDREKIINSTDEIVTAFQKSNVFVPSDRLDSNILDEAYDQYEQQFDEQYGGFGSSPKFPSSHNLMFLLRYADRHQDSKALEMVEKTLTQMRMGGLFDQIGGGFHRYSTDQKWLVPHFEKMLYDQAMLLMAYTEGWQCTKNDLFKQTTDEICSYLMRKMQDENGGFYSAEDADSEGEEGKFYVWSTTEIRELLPLAEAELFIDAYNLTDEGNYHDEATGRKTGKNIPHLQKLFKELAQERDMEPEKLRATLASIREKLLEKRKKRVHPLLDDKILTDWNGLLIAALAKAGSAFENEQYLVQAERCWKFIDNEMLTEKGILKHRYRNGDVAIDGHADDYAFVIWGLLELYEATFRTEYLQQAVSLNEQFVDQFWDDENGGFYFTDETAEELLGRKKEIYDGAMPSGNSIAMLNLLRLGRMTANTEWEEMADESLKLFAESIEKAPTSFGAALQSVDFLEGDSQEIVIAGSQDDSDIEEFIRPLQNRFLPRAVVIFHDPEDSTIGDLVPYLSDFGMKDGKPTAYVCQNYACELPTNSPDKMMEFIE
ncbi:thioredoxin domain-containing protein [Fodinibius sp.]|uniref:thioredoxin domain-containing protein n=1 Tax=Fodinibius sp. TaxID=1872440 RepID=UPI002ACE933D|nr:thioredoxin domain-containing protein [Fodinibius sp.]MDZ7658415.1 thioredoxin domain-containing protein [Fodinibius sp.]